MLALIVAIVLSLRACGFWLRRLPQRSPAHLAVYAVGVTVFVQAAIFLAVSYFGQTIMMWSLTIAMGAFLSEAMSVETARDRAKAAARANAPGARLPAAQPVGAARTGSV
jgi:hypothetical protein